MFKLTSGTGIISLNQRNQKDFHQNEDDDILDSIKIVAVQSLSSCVNKSHGEEIRNGNGCNHHENTTTRKLASGRQVDRLKCQFCGQKMDGLFSLALHLRKGCTFRSIGLCRRKRVISSRANSVYQDDRRFECEICGKRFVFLNDLWKHLSKLCGVLANKNKYLCKSKPALGEERYYKRENILAISSEECENIYSNVDIFSAVETEGFLSSASLFAVNNEERDYCYSEEDLKINVSTSSGGLSGQIFESQGALNGLECEEMLASPSLLISRTQSVKNLLGVSGVGYDSESTVEDEKVSSTNFSLSTDTLSPSSSISMQISDCTPSPRGKRRRSSFAAGYDPSGEHCKLPRNEATQLSNRSADVEGLWTGGENEVVDNTSKRSRVTKGVGSSKSNFVKKDASVIRVHTPDYSVVKVKDYHCEHCSLKFSREAILKSHIKSAHERCGSEASMSSGSRSPRQSPVEEASRNWLQKPQRSTQRSGAAYRSNSDMQSLYVPSPTSSTRERTLPLQRVPMKTHTTQAKTMRHTPVPTSFSERRPIRTSDHRSGFTTSPRESRCHSQIRSLNSSRNFTCKECNKSFATKEELVSDLLRHNETKEVAPAKVFRGVRKTGTVPSSPSHKAAYKCVICGGGFYDHNYMMNHVRSDHSRRGRYGCMEPECPVIRPYALELVHHYDMAHKPSVQTRSDAPRRDSTNALSHNETKGLPGTQNKMKKTLSKKEAPTLTPVPITNSGPYSCKHIHCGQMFQSHNELKNHWKSAHSDGVVMNFLCHFPGCGAPFAFEKGLFNHIRRDHK